VRERRWVLFCVHWACEGFEGFRGNYAFLLASTILSGRIVWVEYQSSC
jgi:hypothetical protein